MSRSAVQSSVYRLRGLLAVQRNHDESDEQLLRAFTDRHDESAFTAPVRRHGPMVLGVCRRVLGHQQDAEDAFQATFLVLARRAAALRDRTALAGFLHATAYHLACKVKRAAGRRRKHEGRAPARSSNDPSGELLWREVRVLLDEEIACLPDIYRSVFVLYYLENQSQAEAGRRLGLKERTVSNRLAEARRRLQERLSRRGVELTAVLAASTLAMPSASALPAVTAASPAVAALAASASPIVRLGKIKLAILLSALTLLAGGSALVPFQTVAENGSPAAEQAKPQSAARLDQESAAYAGRVLDPDGKPVAGAQVYLLSYTPKELPIFFTPKELPIPVRAVSDTEGRFHFRAAHKEFDQSSSTRPWEEALVVATAKGYGLGLPAIQPGKGPRPTEWSLRLSRDVPITGRIIDLQGKPIAGVSVGVHGLYWSAKEDLTGLMADLTEKKEGYPARAPTCSK